jgi:hypothetical protein
MNARVALSIAAALVTGLVLAGCGASGTSNTAISTTAAVSPSATTSPAMPVTTSVDSDTRCHTADLSAAAWVTSAHSRTNMLAVTLTNTGPRPCTAYGFAGLEFADAPAVTIDRAAVTPRLVLLAPEGKAEFLVSFTHPDTPQNWTDCPKPSGLRVIPPDETTQLSAAITPKSPGSDEMHVCAGDRLSVRAVTAAAVSSQSAVIPPGLPDCPAQDLTASAFHSVNGDGMGHSGVQVWLANTSSTDCAIRGRPLVVPDDGSGTATPKCDDACTTDTVLALPAGAVVTANGRTTNGAGDQSPCGTEQPLHATAVRVFLPNDTGVVTGPFGGALYCHGFMDVRDFSPL